LRWKTKNKTGYIFLPLKKEKWYNENKSLIMSRLAGNIHFSGREQKKTERPDGLKNFKTI
jgi:hypothetical protein